MRIVRTRAEIRQAIAEARRAAPPTVPAGTSARAAAFATADDGVEEPRHPRVALVPTMGYLHEGHLALADRARERADIVVMSIFVNPLQFGPGEDLTRYPRDLERDAALAAGRGVDLLFVPRDDEMYPDGAPAVRIVPQRMGDALCGAFRPGHFEGVLTVVAKLFHIVQPDLAIFGQKDYQQAVLIGRMVRDLDIPIEVEVAPIVRDADGLALSSRNVYLDADERARALTLSRGLAAAARVFGEGERDAGRLRDLVREALAEVPGVRPQYIELVHPMTLEPLERAEPGSVLAVAAFVGRTRLIDNLILR